MIRRFFMRGCGLLLCAALLVPLCAGAEMIGTGSSGAEVYRLQQRLQDLDYFSFKPTGSYGAMTRSAVMRFQQYNALSADGTAGDQTQSVLYGGAAARQPIAASIPFGLTEGSGAAGGTAQPWADVDGRFPAGNRCTLVDLTTATELQIQRTGGVNHAEIEPQTAADAQKLLYIFGGTYNWSKRAVVVLLGGERVAASLQGMPHGADVLSGNEAGGSFCLYFSGSRADFGGFVDAEHDATVKKAVSGI